jgi:hypothetical protein
MANPNLNNKKVALVQELEKILKEEGKGDVIIIGSNPRPTPEDVNRAETIVSQMKRSLPKNLAISSNKEKTPFTMSATASNKEKTSLKPSNGFSTNEDDFIRNALMKLFCPDSVPTNTDIETECTEKTCSNCDCNYCPHCEGEDCPNCGNSCNDETDELLDEDEDEILEELSRLKEENEDLEDELTNLEDTCCALKEENEDLHDLLDEIKNLIRNYTAD